MNCGGPPGVSTWTRSTPSRSRTCWGKQSYQLWNQIKAMPRLLEVQGYIEKLGAKYELTPKGMRKIGQRALQDIFTSLTRDALGTHQTLFRGSGMSFLLEESKPYQFGDPFHLNLSRTLMNSLGAEGSDLPPAEELPPARLLPRRL